MPFTQDTFGPVSPGSTPAPTVWTYRTQDAADQVLAVGYFSPKKFQLEPGDLIYVVASDRTDILRYDGNDVIPTRLTGPPVTVLFGFSNATQAPTALNTAQRVEFGAAQGTGTDPVQIDATGLITVNQEGRYNFRAIFSVERTTGTGEAFIFFRVVVNGNQAGNAIVFQLDAQEITLPPQFNFDDDFKANDTIEVQFYRDGQGTPAANDGSLVSYTSQIGWGATPSASLTITKLG